MPKDERILYMCNDSLPTHFSVDVNKYDGYEEVYKLLFFLNINYLVEEIGHRKYLTIMFASHVIFIKEIFACEMI